MFAGEERSPPPAWTSISLDFAAEDETINFGTRRAVEEDGNLFEVTTLATIEPSDEEEDDSCPAPSLQSASKSNVLLAVDSTLIIFTKDCQDARTLLLSSRIDALCISSCTNFAFLGTRSGSVEIVHIPLGRVLASIPLASTLSDNSRRSFLSCAIIGDLNDSTLVWVSTDRLFRLAKLDLVGLDAAVRSNNIEALKEAKARLSIKDLSLEDCVLAAQIFTDPHNNVCVILAHQEGVRLLGVDEECQQRQGSGGGSGIELDLEMFEGQTLAKMVVGQDGRRVHCLDAKGRIHVLCTLTLTVLKIHSAANVADFILLEEEGVKEYTYLLITIQDQGERCMEMRAGADFKLSYKLKVGDLCVPVSYEPSQETPPLLLEAVNDDVLRPHLVQRLRVRGVTEGVPEIRLERILRRANFVEALNFANIFNLNPEPIYKRKVSWLLERLSPWNTSLTDAAKQEEFPQLKECLAKIQDIEYVMECVTLAALPTLDMTRDILLQTRERISSQEEAGELSKKQVLSLGVTMHRLRTYLIATQQPSVQGWITFSREDILNKIKKTLEAGQTTTALLYWMRHKAELNNRLNPQVVGELLCCLPDKLELQAQLNWLNQFIPDSLQTVPSALPAVAAWATAAVMRMELSSRKDWPENGLTFAKEVLSTLQFGGMDNFNTSMTILTLNQQRTSADSELRKLVDLINLLQDLLQLKTNFRIKIKLSEMMDPNKQAVVANILDWVMGGEEVPGLMDNFLIAFINKFQLDQNKVLTEYIMCVLSNTNYTWHWHVGAAPWEDKVANLLPYISSIEEKCQVILETVKQAPVPWSETVQGICATGTSLSHPGAIQVGEQATWVSVKAILRKYECKTFLKSGREAERQIQYIFKRGGEEGYNDVMEICSVMGSKTPLEVKQMFVNHLVEVDGDAVSALKIVAKAMEDSNREGCQLCSHIVDRAGICLKLELGAKVEDAYLQILSSILASYKQFDEESFSTTLEKAQLLKNAALLKHEHGILTAETDWTNRAGSLRNVDNNRSLLNNFLSNKVEKGRTGGGLEVEDTLRQAVRVCDLMGLSHEEAIARYVLELNRGGLYTESLEVAKKLKDSSLDPELANILFSVVYKTELVAGGAADVELLPQLLSKLSANSLVHCQDSALMDSLELYNWQNLTSRIHAESHDSRAYFSSRTASVDVFDQWKFSHAYKDKGLPLEREQILEDGFQCLESILPLVEAPPLPYLPRNTASTVQVCDLDVTRPDLEAVGNGMDAKEVGRNLLSCGERFVFSLQGGGHAQLAFQALQRIESSLQSILLGTDPEFQTEVKRRVAGLRTRLVAELVQRVLQESAATDNKLCLGVLTNQDTKTSLSLLARINTSFGLDYRKMMGLALVGHRLCCLSELAKQADQFLDLYISASWGKKTGQLEIAFKPAFSGSVRERLAVLKHLVAHPKVCLQTLLEYCAAFKIDQDQTLILYSSACIRRMEPTVSNKDDIIQQPDLWELREKTEQAWALFTSPQQLLHHLIEEVGAVSPYNYEGLEILLRGIHSARFPEKLVPEHMDRASQILGFLLQYKRVKAPGPEPEIDPWLKERGTSFPRLGYLRLPLYPLLMLNNKEKCKLLEKEFTLETYRSWILVAGVMGISVDNICMYTVTNTVATINERKVHDRTHSAAATAESSWIISHNNKNTLDQLRTCILEMKNPEKATAASSWIFNRLPRGADKVLAAHGYLSMAEAWAAREPNNQSSKVGLSIASKTKDQLETEEVLFKFNLATPEYLQLVEQHRPLELVTKLFEDDSIVERNRVAAGNYPDIASAVEEISRINRLNSSVVKYDLLDRWLPDSGSNLANMSLTDLNLDLGVGGAAAVDGEEADQEDINLLRCIYILQDGSEDGMRYLNKFALSEDPLVSTGHKLRALKCLFSIADVEEVTRLTGRDVTHLKETMKQLVFIARMEKLNLPFNAATFATCNKDSLVEGIWRTCKHSREGIIVVRDICAEYNIWSQSIWSAILIQLKKFGMMKGLEQTLVLLSAQPQMWNCGELRSSWKVLLLSPFAGLPNPPSEEAEERCGAVLRLVHCCPADLEVELEAVVDECLEAGLGHLAFILLPYLTKKAGERMRERVLNQISQAELTDKLADLKHRGFPVIAG